MKLRFGLGVLAYLGPTFALGFVWHLMLFHGYYEHLAIYRKDIIIPFGFLSMLIQSVLFAWVYQQAFAQRNGSLLSRGLSYAVFGSLLSWSFTTLAVAAKNVMTSVPDYLVIETAFTAVQWIMVGPLTALAFARAPQKASLSSSPWMRGAPQVGFSRHILRIRSRTSREMTGRPGWPRRTFEVQKRRKPARCQATTVSGLTMASAERQSRQR